MDKENKLILYKDEEGRVSVNTRFADEDVWLTQAQFFEQNLPSCMIENEFSGTIFCFGRRDTVRWYVFKNIIDVTSVTVASSERLSLMG